MQDGYDRYRYGLTLLAQGDYAQGLPLYEDRRGGDWPVLDPPKTWPGLGCSEWTGQDLAGKHVLVFGEQGFGDQIMFARFIPALEARGASVTYVCGAGLDRLFPNGHVARKRHDFPPAHYWTLVGSLPLRLGVSVATIPAPYPLRVGRRTGAGIGVVPSGRPTHENDQQRSLGPGAAARLLALGRDLRPEATGAHDFYETAQIIAGLELVISVDTAVAHLAATMGKAVWILLPAVGTDWRWLQGASGSPWYPSARLVRQRPGETWDDVLDRLAADLP